MLQLGILLHCSYCTSLEQSQIVGVTLILHQKQKSKGLLQQAEVAQVVPGS